MKISVEIKDIGKLTFLLNIYISILMLFYLFRIDFLKHIANAFAGFIFLLGALTVIIRLSQLRIRHEALISLVAIVFIIANGAIVTKTENSAELLKVAAIFLFFVCGQLASKLSPTPLIISKLTAYFFIAVPLGAYFIDLALSDILQIKDSTTGTYIFANRNNAALFAVIASYLLLIKGVKENYVIAYILASTLFFQTLGALFSAVAAIYISFFSKKNIAISILLVPFLIVALFLTKDIIPTLTRVSTVTEGLLLIFDSGISLDVIRNTTYAEASLLAGTSDISFFFRLKHWLELFDTICQASPLNLIFGFGINSSLELTSLSLVPHNDYLRMYFEIGAIPFLAFLTINYKIIASIESRKFIIPALFLMFYFFSENLINNFLAMTFFYFIAGVLSAQPRQQLSRPTDMVRFSKTQNHTESTTTISQQVTHGSINLPQI